MNRLITECVPQEGSSSDDLLNEYRKRTQSSINYYIEECIFNNCNNSSIANICKFIREENKLLTLDEYYRQIQETTLNENSKILTSFIQAYLINNSFDNAYNVYKMMIKQNIQMNSFIYSKFNNFIGLNHKYENEFNNLMNDIYTKNNNCLNDYVLNSGIDTYFRLNNMDGLYNLLRISCDINIQWDRITLLTLIKIFTLRKESDKIINILTFMKDNNLRGDDNKFNGASLICEDKTKFNNLRQEIEKIRNYNNKINVANIDFLFNDKVNKKEEKPLVNIQNDIIELETCNILLNTTDFEKIKKYIQDYMSNILETKKFPKNDLNIYTYKFSNNDFNIIKQNLNQYFDIEDNPFNYTNDNSFNIIFNMTNINFKLFIVNSV